VRADTSSIIEGSRLAAHEQDLAGADCDTPMATEPFNLRLPDIPGLTLVAPHHEALRQRALEVADDEIHSPVITALLDRMLEVAHGKTLESSGVRLVGLAAPQIGIRKRIILVDTVYAGVDPRNEPSAMQFFLNPAILERSEATELRREGCNSTTSHVHGLVERASTITIDALARDGQRIRSTFDGFSARVFQHEIDHLDGVCFPDRIHNDEHLHWLDTAEDIKTYRHRAEHWKVLCPRERWEAIKAGTWIRQP